MVCCIVNLPITFLGITQMNYRKFYLMYHKVGRCTILLSYRIHFPAPQNDISTLITITITITITNNQHIMYNVTGLDRTDCNEQVCRSRV